jgi:uncharacterized membrane protein YtjA (UPF0391 family)
LTKLARSPASEFFPPRAGGRLFFPKEKKMLYWTLIFLVVAIIAAAFGFTGIAAGAAGIARVLFALFLILFLISLLLQLFGHGTPPL